MGRVIPRAVPFADRQPPRVGVPTMQAQVLNKITHGVNYLVYSRTGNQLLRAFVVAWQFKCACFSCSGG